MTALRLRLQKEIFDVTEEQLVSDCPLLSSISEEEYSKLILITFALMTCNLYGLKWMPVLLAWPKAAMPFFVHCIVRASEPGPYLVDPMRENNGTGKEWKGNRLTFNHYTITGLPRSCHETGEKEERLDSVFGQNQRCARVCQNISSQEDRQGRVQKEE